MDSKELNFPTIFFNTPEFEPTNSIPNHLPIQKSTNNQTENFFIEEEKSDEELLSYNQFELLKIPIINRKLLPYWRRMRIKLFAVNCLRGVARQVHLLGGDFDVLKRNQLGRKGPQKVIHHTSPEEILIEKNTETKEVLPRTLFHPSGTIKIIWNIILVFLLIETAILMPFILAFIETHKEKSWELFEFIVDILFMLDILVNFNSAYYNLNGVLIKERKAIAFNYLKTWFILDLVASFPFDLIKEQEEEHTGETGDIKNMLRLLRLPRLYRLIRISRLLKMMKSSNTEFFELVQDFFSIEQSKVRLLKSLMTIILMVHIFGCLWYFVARLDGFHPNTWVVRSGTINENTFYKYITCIYWTITTLTSVGYGDLVPNTLLEKLLSMTLMLVGMYTLSFTIGSLSSMVSNIDSKENVLMNKLAAIENFSKEVKIDRELYYRLKHSIRYSNGKTGFSWSEKESIFNELSTDLKYKVALTMHGGMIHEFTYFINKGSVFVSEIFPFLKPTLIVEKECVYVAGEYAHEIYFLIRGRINYIESKNTVVRCIRFGNYFGDIEVVKEVPRMFAAEAERDSELLVMNKNLINKIKTEFKKVWKEMSLVARERKEKIDRQIVELEEYRQMHSSEFQTEAFQEKIDEILAEKKKKDAEKKTDKIGKKYSKEDGSNRPLEDEIRVIISYLTKLDGDVQEIKEMEKNESFIGAHSPIPQQYQSPNIEI